MRNRFHRMLSILGTNFCACSASGKMWTLLHVQSILSIRMQNEFYHTLSIRGTNFIACWANWEPISSHAEHARKCLKVEYLRQIEYDFQKSCVTGPWDHKVSVSAKKVKKNVHACVPLRNIGQSLILWNFFYAYGSYFSSWIRMRIANPDPDTDPGTPLNPDPTRVWIRIPNTGKGFQSCEKLDIHWKYFGQKISENHTKDLPYVKHLDSSHSCCGATFHQAFYEKKIQYLHH